MRGVAQVQGQSRCSRVWHPSQCGNQGLCELAGLGCLVSPHGLYGRLELTQSTAVRTTFASVRARLPRSTTS
eukprot:5240121-Prymnesium_polylepis.1